MSLIGLAIVFAVLVILMIVIYGILFVDNKFMGSQNSKIVDENNVSNEKNLDDLNLKQIAAMIGLGLALTDNSGNKMHDNEIVKVSNEESAWVAYGIQRLFKTRGN